MDLENERPVNILRSSQYSDSWTSETITFANLLEDIELFSKLGMHSKAYLRKQEALDMFIRKEKRIKKLESSSKNKRKWVVKT